MSLYKLVTTENVDLNYKAFKKDELIDCILNLRTTYFRLKKENEEINFLGNCYGENARCLDLLIKENQKLKSQLKGTTHCFDEEEHEKLKKQLEEYKDNYNCLLKQKEQFEYIMSKQVDYQGQQKEFIKYLEDYLKLFDYMCIDEQVYYDMIEEILQKYKSIIGDDK